MQSPVRLSSLPCETASWPGRPNVQFGWTLDDGREAGLPTPEICFRLADEAGRTPVCLRQVHGSRVLDFVPGPTPSLDAPPEGDGWLTSRHDILGGVSVADCAPVFLACEEGFGVLHAGWRGVVAGILPAAMAKIEAAWGTPAAGVELILGPCIGPCCFEVSGAVVALFPPHVRRRHGDRWHIDLPGTLLHQWLAAGGHPGRFRRADRCTVCAAPRLHSHRRAPGRGRNFAFLYRLD